VLLKERTDKIFL